MRIIGLTIILFLLLVSQAFAISPINLEVIKEAQAYGKAHGQNQLKEFLLPWVSYEEKAANLLYFIVKNHSFIDGNKRIAASIFLWFLEKNRLLYKDNGLKRIADNALVALTLMIAESDPEEHDIIVKLVVNLINKNN